MGKLKSKEEYMPPSMINRVNKDYKVISKAYVDICKYHKISELDFDRYMNAVEDYTWAINVFPKLTKSSTDYCIDKIGNMDFEIIKDIL